MTQRQASSAGRASRTAPNTGSERPCYSVVVLPPREVGDRLRDLQRRIGVAEGEPYPHLSLKMPFHLRMGLEEVKRRIAQVAVDAEPVTISICGLGSFDGPYSRAIYAAVESNDCLQELHAALVRGLEGATGPVYPYTEEIELSSYVPHLTIASDLSGAELGALLRRLKDVTLDDNFRMTELDLWRRDARGRWRLVQSFPLRGAARRRQRCREARRLRQPAMSALARRSAEKTW